MSEARLLDDAISCIEIVLLESGPENIEEALLIEVRNPLKSVRNPLKSVRNPPKSVGNPLKSVRNPLKSFGNPLSSVQFNLI